MKWMIVLLTALLSLAAASQSTSFPQSWEGNWKGELSWYKTGKTDPQKVDMELRIHPSDSVNTWTWQIIYGAVTQDNRPYKLILTDTAQIHWVIDEQNGIVLDQYWVGNKFCGAFTVMGSTIINNYWVENDQLMVEFFSISARPVAITGKGTEESPAVDSYQVNSYQKAVLQRAK
ncbi:MAG: hypothetical protein SGI83_09870 [Bacteroidota bacterium]|nr:hypothetical protein [Bacteroidota bacterium]